jgi:hypothetical protein
MSIGFRMKTPEEIRVDATNSAQNHLSGYATYRDLTARISHFQATKTEQIQRRFLCCELSLSLSSRTEGAGRRSGMALNHSLREAM